MIPLVHKDLDKFVLIVLFVFLVALAAYFRSVDKVFDLCNDTASASFGALLVLVTKKDNNNGGPNAKIS